MVRANFGEVDEVVGAAKPAVDVRFAISSNPGPGMFQVEFGAPLKRSTVIEVHDLAGRLLLSGDLSAGIRTTEIDLRTQPTGVYFLSIGGMNAGKLVVER
jgi:hypothetical protein